MARIGAGVADSENTFRLNGLDYPKNRYEIYYSNVQVDSNKNIDENLLRIGIRSIADKQENLQEPIEMTQWENLSGTAYSSLNILISDLITFLGFNVGGGSGVSGATSRIFSGEDQTAAELARDSYYATNPSERVTGTTIILTYGDTAQNQFWDGSSWVNLGSGASTAQDVSYSYTNDLSDPKISTNVKQALDRIITQVDGGFF